MQSSMYTLVKSMDTMKIAQKYTMGDFKFCLDLSFELYLFQFTQYSVSQNNTYTRRN